MKLPVWAWIAIAGGAAYAWANRVFKRINFGSVSSPYQKLNATNIELDVVLPVYNTSGVAATISGFYGFIVNASNDAVLARLNLSSPVKIPALGEANLTFRTQIEYIDALGEGYNLYQLLADNSGETNPALSNYKIIGSIKVFGFQFDVETPLG